MKMPSLLPSLALLGATLLVTSPAFAKKKDKDKDKDKAPQTNQGANGSGRPAVAQAQSVKLKVENNTGQVVSVSYLSPQGTLDRVGELPADGKKHEINAFAGQTWVFKAGKQVVQTYQATNESKQSLNLRGGGSAPQPAPAAPPLQRNVDRENGAPEGGERAAFLRVHNDARAQVRVAPLRWDQDCADAAQGWANTLAQRDRGLSHSGRRDYGENVWAGSGRAFTPADAARDWGSEISSYNGGVVNETNVQAVGHYTQMVWSGTTAVGYGIARSARGMIYIVANYAPPGNMLGQRPYGR